MTHAQRMLLADQPMAGHAARVCNPGGHPPAAVPDHRLARLRSGRIRLHPGNPSTDPQVPPFWVFRLSSGASVQPARPAHTQPAESKPPGVQQAAKGTSAPARVARHCHTLLIERNLPPGSSSCAPDALGLGVRVLGDFLYPITQNTLNP